MTLDEVIQNVNLYYEEYKSSAKDENSSIENHIDESSLKLSVENFKTLMKMVKKEEELVFKPPLSLEIPALKWYFKEDKIYELADKLIQAQIYNLELKAYSSSLDEKNYNFSLINTYFLKPIIGKKRVVLQNALGIASSSTQLSEIKRYLKAGAMINAYDINKLPVNIAAWNASNVECLIYLINQGGHFWFKRKDSFHTEILDVYQAVKAYMKIDDEYTDDDKEKFEQAFSAAKSLEEQKHLNQIIVEPKKNSKAKKI